jgi:hypothetical protein
MADPDDGRVPAAVVVAAVPACGFAACTEPVAEFAVLVTDLAGPVAEVAVPAGATVPAADFVVPAAVEPGADPVFPAAGVAVPLAAAPAADLAVPAADVPAPDTSAVAPATGAVAPATGAVAPVTGAVALGVAAGTPAAGTAPFSAGRFTAEPAGAVAAGAPPGPAVCPTRAERMLDWGLAPPADWLLLGGSTKAPTIGTGPSRLSTSASSPPSSPVRGTTESGNADTLGADAVAASGADTAEVAALAATAGPPMRAAVVRTLAEAMPPTTIRRFFTTHSISTR